MVMQQLEAIKYNEALKLPKLQASIERLVNRKEFWELFTDYHLHTLDEVSALVNKALIEGNGILVQPEYCGYFVTIWKED